MCNNDQLFFVRMRKNSHFCIAPLKRAIDFNPAIYAKLLKDEKPK